MAEARKIIAVPKNFALSSQSPSILRAPVHSRSTNAPPYNAWMLGSHLAEEIIMGSTPTRQIWIVLFSLTLGVAFHFTETYGQDPTYEPTPGLDKVKSGVKRLESGGGILPKKTRDQLLKIGHGLLQLEQTYYDGKAPLQTDFKNYEQKVKIYNAKKVRTQQEADDLDNEWKALSTRIGNVNKQLESRFAAFPREVKRAFQSVPTVKNGLQKVDKLIKGGKKLGFEQAVINLQQWRNGKGDRVMPASSFQSEKFFLNHLQNKHRNEFIKGAQKRMKSGALAIGKTVEMEWTDSVNAPLNSDLWFALGGFTVHSKVKVKVVAGTDGKPVLEFQSWKSDISDKYNWDAKKATMVPLVGVVKDNELKDLEKAGFGKAFNITSGKATITSRGVTGRVSLGK